MGGGPVLWLEEMEDEEEDDEEDDDDEDRDRSLGSPLSAASPERGQRKESIKIQK